MLKKTFLKLTVAFAVLMISTIGLAEEEKVVNVFNWSDYIAKDTLELFEKETGIKPVYDVFDSNEVLETKLLAGGSGFDVVFPSNSFLGKQLKAGVFKKLDKSKFKNYGNLDEAYLKLLAYMDKDNEHSIPYMWGTTGIGYNVDKVKKALGENVPVDSWDILFKPENISKLTKCGVAFLDAPTEVLPAVLNYLKLDPNSTKASDYTDKAYKVLEKVRPYITYFHSSKYINDLANGDICIALGWSGDVIQAQSRATEAKNGVNVAYVIPKEGAALWFDMMAIPKDAKHPDNAHKFLDFFMKPEIIAGISNHVAYANANKASYPLIDKAIMDNKGIYPSEETKKNLFMFKLLPLKITRTVNRTWTKIKTGK
ncbi:extracellular solute-binding protein [Desulfococcaceae bacterium HSG9]|nr:extracellular solute-binding protein [Desulfococcaceae bacterium HSG9]